MSTRFYCDLCEKQMSPSDLKNLFINFEGVRFEVTVTHNALVLAPPGHICHGCIKKAMVGAIVEDGDKAK